MTTRTVIAVLLALFVTSPTHADGPSEAESIARLDRAVEAGHFVVLSGHGVTLAIIGPAYEGLAQGPVLRLGAHPTRDVIIVAKALRTEHPRSLDTLRRRAVRIATDTGFCSGRLGSVLVVDVASRQVLNMFRDAPMTDREELDETWERGAYVAAVIERGCPGVLATTRVEGTPTRGAVVTLSSAEVAEATLVFAGSSAARMASAFRAESGSADHGGFIEHVGFSVGEDRRLVFVSEVIPDVGHCSGRRDVFTTVLDRRGGVTRSLSLPRGAAQPHALVFDIDGDGALEILLSDFLGDGDVSLFTLPLDGTALVPVGGFGINYNIGC